MRIRYDKAIRRYWAPLPPIELAEVLVSGGMTLVDDPMTLMQTLRDLDLVD